MPEGGLKTYCALYFQQPYAYIPAPILVFTLSSILSLSTLKSGEHAPSSTGPELQQHCNSDGNQRELHFVQKKRKNIRTTRGRERPN
jgi:hypothetical protein